VIVASRIVYIVYLRTYWSDVDTLARNGAPQTHALKMICFHPLINMYVPTFPTSRSAICVRCLSSFPRVILHLLIGSFCTDPRLPRTVVKRHRKRATFIWISLLLAFFVCEPI